MIPENMVSGIELEPSNRVMYAANGSPICIAGEISLTIKFNRRCRVKVKFVVSSQIFEVMLGMDFLMENKCNLSFGTGSLFIGRKRLVLMRKDGVKWCRRIHVSETVVIPPKSQVDVSARMSTEGGNDLEQRFWMTQNCEVRPGVQMARVVISTENAETMVRILNLNESPVMLENRERLGEAFPVTIPDISQKQHGENETQVIAKLIELTVDVTDEEKGQLERLLRDYIDVFSLDENDMGLTTVTQHSIDTGDSRPMRQSLRRQPTPYQQEIDKHVE